MSSFYGGQQGTSFTLKASFASIADMQEAFAGGSNYTNVWYHEYCLIDTPNKNNKDNGKIFQRGLDYQSPTSGAIYVGQIVGPSSGTPYMQIGTIDNVEAKADAALSANEYKRYPVSYDEITNNYVISDGTDGQELGVFPFDSSSDSLVPGKYIDDEGVTHYNDSINWSWCNIRKDNADADSWFYLGFEFPYLVTDVEARAISQYDEFGNIKEQPAYTKRLDDKTHPYYSNWEFNIPKGIKGDTNRNIRTITVEGSEVIYLPSAIQTNPQTGLASFDATKTYDAASAVDKKITVLDYYFYDSLLNPEPITIYIGEFNSITDITVGDDGTITVTYTYDDPDVFTKKMKWVDSVSLTTADGADGGRFTIEYNNGAEPFEAEMTWVNNIGISDDGDVTYTYSGTNNGTINPSGVVTQSNLIKWVDGIALDTVTGEFQVDYNYGAPYLNTLTWVNGITLESDGYMYAKSTTNALGEQIGRLRWITGMSLNTTTGIFTTNFNYGDPLVAQMHWVSNILINEDTGDITLQTVGKPDQTVDAKLKLINSINVSSTGIVTFQTNTGDNYTAMQTGTSDVFHIKNIENVILNTRINEDKRIQIKYNTEIEPTSIGAPINYIEDTVVRSSDFHLLVLFSDPTHRATASELDSAGYDNNGNLWVNNIAGSNGAVYDASVYWRDYGAIKDQAGVLIGFNLTQADIGEGVLILDYLNETYPEGLTGADNMPGGIATQGKIITFATGIENEKEFYAFDYSSGTPGHWFYLGMIGDAGGRDVVLALDTVTPEEIAELTSGGMLFKGKTFSISENGLPEYWNRAYNIWT